MDPPQGEHPGREAQRARLWAFLWSLPVATMWERHGDAPAVFRYVELYLVWAADPEGAAVTAVAELRHLELALALSAGGMLRARAQVGEDPATTSAMTGSAFIDLTGWADAEDDSQDDADTPAKFAEVSDLDDGPDLGWQRGPAC